MKTKKPNKTKAEYKALFEDMIEHYSKEENKDKFDYKRYYLERGFSITAVKHICAEYPELRALYIEVKHIIIATLTRMILENKINKDAFAIRTMKLMFKDLTYHTPEEIAAIEKLKAERALDDAGSREINFTIGFKEEDNKDV